MAALGTLSFGAVLGPEAPLIALGSVVGMAVAPRFNLNDQEKAVLATAGSFAAIAALFGGPIPAGVLLIEAGIALGARLIPMMLPGLVAAAIGYLIFTGVGDWGGIDQTVLEVPGLPHYDTVRIVDLVIAVGVGVLAAIVVTVVHRLAAGVNSREGRRIGMAHQAHRWRARGGRPRPGRSGPWRGLAGRALLRADRRCPACSPRAPPVW